MSSAFRVDVLDNSNNKLGSGPLANVITLSDNFNLDEIPTATFTMPAGESSAALITAGVKFDLYDPLGDEYLGRFYYSSRSMGKTLSIKCVGEAVELTRETAGFRRSFNYVSVTSTINTLLGLVSGWTSDIEAAFNSVLTVITLEGESPYRGLDEVRDRFGHFRFMPNKLMEFGAFGADSGVRLTNTSGQAGNTLGSEIAIITDSSVSMIEEVDEIYNSIVAVGSGQGEDVQLTMYDATAGGDYTVQSRANDDGTLMYYIQDATSVSTYGERWKIMSFPQIRPIDNSTTARQRAALALKLTAETYMKRHLEPKVVYQINEVYGLTTAIKPGQKLHVDYRGIVNGYGYMRIDGDYWIMGISRSRNSDGGRSTKLTLANSDAKRTSDTDIILGIQNDLRAMKVHIPANPALDRINHKLLIKAGKSETFDVNIGLETKSLLSAILRFKTEVLRSPTESVAGTSTTTPEGGGSVTPSDEGSSSPGGGGSITPSGEGSSSPGGGEATADASTTYHVHETQCISTSAGAGWEPMYIKTTGITAGLVGYNDGGGGSDQPFSTGYQDVQHQHTIPEHIHIVPAHQHTTPEHTHTVPAHQHTTPVHQHTFTPELSTAYGVFQDTVYPAGVGVKINGVDLGISIGTSGSSTTHEVTITDELNNAIGGLQQRHTIEFYCASSYGRIEVEVHMVASIQAIAAY